jgi:ferredoxin
VFFVIKIVFRTNEGDIEVDGGKGASLLDTMRLDGIDLEAPCGGKGVCGKCRVIIESGNDNKWSDEEIKFF